MKKKPSWLRKGKLAPRGLVAPYGYRDIVLRGCFQRVPADQATQLQAAEAEQLRTDWNRNQLD